MNMRIRGDGLPSHFQRGTADLKLLVFWTTTIYTWIGSEHTSEVAPWFLTKSKFEIDSTVQMAVAHDRSTTTYTTTAATLRGVAVVIGLILLRAPCTGVRMRRSDHMSDLVCHDVSIPEVLVCWIQVQHGASDHAVGTRVVDRIIWSTQLVNMCEPTPDNFGGD